MTQSGKYSFLNEFLHFETIPKTSLGCFIRSEMTDSTNSGSETALFR